MLEHRLLFLARATVKLAMAATIFLLWYPSSSTASEDPLQPPELSEVRTRYPNVIEVHWWNVSVKEQETPDGIRVNIYETDDFAASQNFPGDAGRATLDVKDDTYKIIKFDTYYCVGLQYFNGSGSNIEYSPESNRLCASTAAEGSQPLSIVAPQEPPPALLAIEGIRGREELEWARVANTTPAYLIGIKNSGNDATRTVLVEIATSGVVTLADQPPFVAQGWAADGFTCSRAPASGGANALLRCTGGTLKFGQSTSPAILIRPTGRGFGVIHASIDVSSGTPEEPSTRQDNALALSIRVL